MKLKVPFLSLEKEVGVDMYWLKIKDYPNTLLKKDN